jgi:hypothetical protein
MKTFPYVRAAVAAASLALLAGCESAAEGPAMPPPPEVSVAEVLVRDVQHWDEFTGRIEAVESVELRPRVSGHIERVNFTEGGEVAKGEVLFVIDRVPTARPRAGAGRAGARPHPGGAGAGRAGRVPGSLPRPGRFPPRSTTSGAPPWPRPRRTCARRARPWTSPRWTSSSRKCGRRSPVALAARW